MIWHRLLDSIDANGPTFIEYLAVTSYIPELIGGLLGALVGAAVAAEVGGVVNVITSGFGLVGSANIFVSVAGIIGGFLLGAKESTVAIDLGGDHFRVTGSSSPTWHDALGIVCENYSAAMPPQLPTSPLPV